MSGLLILWSRVAKGALPDGSFQKVFELPGKLVGDIAILLPIGNIISGGDFPEFSQRFRVSG